MKRLFLTVLIFGSVTLMSNGFAPQGKAQAPSKETAIIEIADKTKLLDVLLQGAYLFEHDDQRMARGEPCMFVYAYVKGKAGDKVVSFHCQPVERQKAKQVVLSVSMTREPDVYRLTEVQFAGSTKGHKIPQETP